MGYEARKTEHSGPKRGNGAYWGYKWEAKRESNRIRRENAKREIRAAAIDSDTAIDLLIDIARFVATEQADVSGCSGLSRR